MRELNGVKLDIRSALACKPHTVQYWYEYLR